MPKQLNKHCYNQINTYTLGFTVSHRLQKSSIKMTTLECISLLHWEMKHSPVWFSSKRLIDVTQILSSLDNEFYKNQRTLDWPHSRRIREQKMEVNIYLILLLLVLLSTHNTCYSFSTNIWWTQQSLITDSSGKVEKGSIFVYRLT